MADSPYVNKVEYDGQTLMDLTGDTATPSDVLSGVTFHDRSGAAQTGSLITHNVYDGLDSSSTSDALSANQGRILNSSITKQTGTATIPSGITNNALVLEKSGNVCTINGKLTIGTSISGNGGLLMTLPSGFRPSSAFYVYLYGTYNSVDQFIRIKINTDGKMETSQGSLTVTGAIHLSIAFCL